MPLCPTYHSPRCVTSRVILPVAIPCHPSVSFSLMFLLPVRLRPKRIPPSMSYSPSFRHPVPNFLSPPVLEEKTSIFHLWTRVEPSFSIPDRVLRLPSLLLVESS